jgi:hypothetical protein
MDGALISSCFFLLPTVCPDRSLESGILSNDVSPFIPFSEISAFCLVSCPFLLSIPGPMLYLGRDGGDVGKLNRLADQSSKFPALAVSSPGHPVPFGTVPTVTRTTEYHVGSSRASLVADFLSSVAVHFYLLSPHFRMLVSLRGSEVGWVNILM